MKVVSFQSGTQSIFVHVNMSLSLVKKEKLFDPQCLYVRLMVTTDIDETGKHGPHVERPTLTYIMYCMSSCMCRSLIGVCDIDLVRTYNL